MTPNELMSRAKMQLMAIPTAAFYINILFQLKVVWTDKVQTAGVDGTNMFMNEKFFTDLTDATRIGLLVHEVLHVALNHIIAMADDSLNKEVANIAQDHVINLSMTSTGIYEIPPGGHCNQKYQNMTWKEVYDILMSELKDQQAKGLGPGPDGIKVPGGRDVIEPKNKADKEQTKGKIADIVMKAVSISKAAKSSIPGEIAGEFEIALQDLTDPKLPWEMLFQSFMSEYAKEDYTWAKPNRRYMPDFYLPSAHSEKLCNIAAAVDASCSVSDKQFSSFPVELQKIQHTLQPELITVITFDTSIREIQEIHPHTHIPTELHFTGRGGTDLNELFEWAIDNDPTVLIIFTDGEVYMPKEFPDCPIIWLIHNNEYFTCDKGRIIHYELEE